MLMSSQHMLQWNELSMQENYAAIDSNFEAIQDVQESPVISNPIEIYLDQNSSTSFQQYVASYSANTLTNNSSNNLVASNASAARAPASVGSSAARRSYANNSGNSGSRYTSSPSSRSRTKSKSSSSSSTSKPNSSASSANSSVAQTSSTTTGASSSAPNSGNSEVADSSGSNPSSGSGSVAENPPEESPPEESTNIVAENINNLTLYRELEQTVTLTYSGGTADQCFISAPVNLSETSACSCVAGVCTVGITGDALFTGAASFSFYLAESGLNSELATASVNILEVGGPFPGDVYDNLNPKNFTNNFGSYNWSGDWQESGESDGATSGVVQIANKGVPGPNQCQAGNCIVIGSNIGDTGDYSLQREVNLAGASSATLEFDWRRDNALGYFSTEDLLIQVSSDGGASWNTVFTIATGASDPANQAELIDISTYISHETFLRITTQNNALIDGFVYIDNVKITGSN